MTGVNRGAGAAGDGPHAPSNVVPLPRRLRDYPTWDAFLASYAPGPAEPGKVLAFVRPTPEPRSAP